MPLTYYAPGIHEHISKGITGLTYPAGNDIDDLQLIFLSKAQRKNLFKMMFWIKKMTEYDKETLQINVK